MNFIEVNGVSLRYDVQGSGKPLVLIHEMGGTMESWDLVVPALSAKRRVIRYDTRGAGFSEKIRGVLKIATMTNDLIALLDALGVKEKVALAGTAVGGAIALHTAVRHPDRVALAREFGATEVVSERGEAAVERVRELTGGLGAHSVLECVGHGESMSTALGIARPGGAVGRVGVPQSNEMPEAKTTFYRNVTISGGPAPVRAYIEELMPDVLEGRIQPGKVFDSVTNLDGVPDGYRAMNDRKSIKVMIKF